MEIPPFTPVTWQDQQRNLEMMRDADVILVADMPFGENNLMNLEGLEQMKGQNFFPQKLPISGDYTGGRLVERLQQLGEKKKICLFLAITMRFWNSCRS